MKQYEMRRATRSMNEAEIQNLLEHGAYCVVSCIDANGLPYGVPLSYVYAAPCSALCEPGAGALYFHTTDQGGRKMDAFLSNGHASITIVENVAARFENASFTTGFSSVMASGRIRRITDPAVARKALVNLCMKYLPEHKRDIGAAMQADFATTAVWALDIDEIRGKRN